jgi:peptidoglycan/xylan/chitin deacetylase (PgdA/CDA1 family)
MRIVSPFLKKAVYPSLSKTGLFRRLPGRGLGVVTYHGVLPEGYRSIDAVLDGNLIAAGALRQQLRFLKAHYNMITPGELLAAFQQNTSLPPRSVLISCDDGLLNCFTDMLPVLLQEKVSCLFFVTGNSTGLARKTLWYEDLYLVYLQGPAGRHEIYCDGVLMAEDLTSIERRRASWWNSVKRLSQASPEIRGEFLATTRRQLGADTSPELQDAGSATCRRFALLTASELGELAAAGMQIGAHTLSHPVLSQAPAESAYFEIAESRAQLEATLQSKVWAFAYPFGDAQSVTPEVLAMPQQAGYAAAFMNFGGGLSVPLPRYALPRVHVTSAMSISELDAHVSGFYALLQRRGRGYPAEIRAEAVCGER